MTPNEQAFCHTIAESEGTINSSATKNSGYDVIVTGIDGEPETFSDYSTHPFANGRPPKIINSAGLESTASGRYQILLRYYNSYKASINLPDFSPASQDAIALQMISECDAIGDINAGNLASAIAKCSSRWASLPGNDYGQHENTLQMLTEAYTNAGGTLTT